MDTEPMPSQALKDIPTIEGLEDLLITERGNESLALQNVVNIQRRIGAIQVEIQSRLEERRVTAIDDALTDARDIKDLLIDPSYENDASFERSAQDNDRRDAYQNRMESRTSLYNSVLLKRHRLRGMNADLTSIPSQIKSLETQIIAVDKQWFLKDRTRSKLEARKAALVTELDALPGQVAELSASLVATEQDFSETPANNEYVRELHTDESFAKIAMSPRSEQSALVSFEAARRGGTFTMRLPQQFGEQDFTADVVFNFEERDDAEEFGELLGLEIQTENNPRYDNIDEHIRYGQDFYDELVPFPLEVVESDGYKFYRLPQPVWDRFGQFAA